MHPVRTRFIKLAFLAVIFANAGSCSLYQNYERSEPAKVLELEARLVHAGFRRVPIETPEQDGAVEDLPLHRLNRYASADGSVFWYADPTICQCLYVGDQRAYDSYAGILEQEHDIAEYMNNERPEQIVNLTPFGYAFPPPLIFGRWPVGIRSYGHFHSGGGSGGSVTSKNSGGGGRGVTSRSHGGGGIHSRGGHGGGHHGGGIHGRH